jgi:hypothetical protein
MFAVKRKEAKGIRQRLQKETKGIRQRLVEQLAKDYMEAKASLVDLLTNEVSRSAQGSLSI